MGERPARRAGCEVARLRADCLWIEQRGTTADDDQRAVERAWQAWARLRSCPAWVSQAANVDGSMSQADGLDALMWPPGDLAVRGGYAPRATHLCDSCSQLNDRGESSGRACTPYRCSTRAAGAAPKRQITPVGTHRGYSSTGRWGEGGMGTRPASDVM